MKTRPICPRCVNEQHVRSTGGGTYGSYYYKCNHCKATWSQVPPGSSDDNSKQVKLVFQRKQRTAYACGKCGISPKKGHICTVKDTIRKTNTIDKVDEEEEALDVLLNLPALIPIKPVVQT